MFGFYSIIYELFCLQVLMSQRVLLYISHVLSFVKLICETTIKFYKLYEINAIYNYDYQLVLLLQVNW